jgi:hypothetical protein
MSDAPYIVSMIMSLCVIALVLVIRRQARTIDRLMAALNKKP